MTSLPIFFPNHPSEFDAARIVVIPVPFDSGDRRGRGASRGPRAILEASAQLEGYDIETETEVYRHGLYTDAPMETVESPEDLAVAVQARVSRRIEQKRFCVLLGGEASASIGAVTAYAQAFEDFSVLQLGAHANLRPSYQGSTHDRACVMSRIKEQCPFVQVGTRSMDLYERHGANIGNIFLAQDIHGRNDWVDDVIGRLSQRVYVTMDLDVFDSALMPSVDRPEPGGVDWYAVLRLLKKVCQRCEVVGFDLMGLSPKVGWPGPDYLAANLVYKTLSYRFLGQSYLG